MSRDPISKATRNEFREDLSTNRRRAKGAHHE
jgi:hypothetical protein